MKGNKRTPSPVDFYEEEVLRSVFERLDSVFPEFDFRRNGRGWVATNGDFTRDRFDARPERVVCNRPGGFLVHGADAVSWLEFRKGFKPTGRDFVEGVKDLARAAGVDTSPLERELTPEQAAELETRQRRADILETFAALCHAALLKSEAGGTARAYLTNNRGFREDELESLPLGFYPGVEAIRARLQKEGFSAEELEASGVLADGRWYGRLVIPWRDQWGRISTAAARDLQGSEPKYLYLTNGTKPAAFGLDDARRTEAARREGLVVVEGLLDVVLLQARGFDNVAALGGAGGLLNAERWAALTGMGFPAVTLALDADEPGREGARRALENLRNVRNARKVYVVSPGALRGAKDPDELVRAHGLDAFREALRSARPWPLYLGESVLEGVTPQSADSRDKREAAERVLDLSADLSGHHAALDREDLLRLASERTGYGLETLQGLSQERQERRERERTAEEAKAAAREMREALERPGANVYETVSRFSGRLAELGRPAAEEPPPFSVDAMFEELRNMPAGIPSGWEALDRLGVRFNPGELSLLAARTGHGKTSALVNLLWRWLSADLAGPMVFYSFEEPAPRVTCRLAVLVSTEGEKVDRWDSDQIRDYLRSPWSRGPKYAWPGGSEDVERLRGRLRACESKFSIVHCPGWSASRLAAHARELADRHGGLGAVFVDYLQRIPAEAKADRRDIEVSAIGRALKGLAVDAVVPVIAGAQINREAITAKHLAASRNSDVVAALRDMRDARPELHHLREGGSEQEADMVLGLMNYAADLRAEAEEGDRRTNRYDVGVLKNRYGEQGRWVALAFEGEFGLIRDREAGDEEGLL